MGPGEIPWTAIDRYAQRQGYDEEEFERLLFMLRKMDATYFEYQNDKSAKRTASND